MPREPVDLWITGYGLLSPHGDSQACWESLDRGARAPTADVANFPVTPITDFDPNAYVQKRADTRQMGPLMLYGVAAATRALAMARIDSELLQRHPKTNLHIHVATGGGEREQETDEATMRACQLPDSSQRVNETLMAARPSLFLTQMPNMIASNICITRGVAVPSRTLVGTETAGVDALRSAASRIRSRQADAILVGGVKNAQCMNFIMSLAGRGLLRDAAYRSVWRHERDEEQGICPGSAAGFVVLESAEHARARGAEGFARLRAVDSSFAPREQDTLCEDRLLERYRAATAGDDQHALGVISGLCGFDDVARRERKFVAGVRADASSVSVRAPAVACGYAMEAAFFVQLCLAVESLRHGRLFAPLDRAEPLEDAPLDAALKAVLVTSWGATDGEGFAKLEAIT